MTRRKVANTESARGVKPPGGQRQARRRYARPTLHIYGSVAQLTMTGTGSTSDGAMSMMGSDMRMKQDIVRVGDHPIGIGLYLFRYKPAFAERWGSGIRFGVMADEVLGCMPEAVSVGDDGYKQVDYAMLGVRPSAT